MNRTRLLVIILVVVFLVIPLVLFGLYTAFWKPANPSTEIITTVDQDTGETLQTFPGVSPERDGNTSITIIGLVPLSNDIFRPQLVFIREQIATYNSTILKDKYSLIALLPNTYRNNNGIITVDLRLGETEDIISAKITALKNGDTQLEISDPSGDHGGGYKSKKVTFYGD